MSGLTAEGAKQGFVVTQKRRPDYSDKSPHERLIDKKSSVTLPNMGTIKGGLRIGIRIRKGQIIQLLKIEGKGKNLNAKEEGNPPTIARELEEICPADSSGDQWMGYTATYDPGTHGGGPFDTQLQLYPTNGYIHDNGFQTVSIAVTTAGDDFRTGSYLVATSVLPGENSLMMHRSIQLARGTDSKSLGKGKASARKKTSNRKTSASRRGKKRKGR